MNQDIILKQKNIREYTGLPIKRFYSVKLSCRICLDPLLNNENSDSNDIFRTNCGDTFHKTCITEHLQQAVSQNYRKLTCPSQGCNEKLSGSLLRKLAFSKVEINKYFNHQLQDMMILHPDKLSICPTAGCANIYIINKDKKPYLNCEFCQKNYCLQCKSEAHPQFTCVEFQNSRKQQNNEIEFKKLVEIMNCKQCSKCGAWILKEKGCNHMKCSCGYEFCYKCGRKYRDKDCKCPLFDRDSMPQP